MITIDVGPVEGGRTATMGSGFRFDEMCEGSIVALAGSFWGSRARVGGFQYAVIRQLVVIVGCEKLSRAIPALSPMPAGGILERPRMCFV